MTGIVNALLVESEAAEAMARAAGNAHRWLEQARWRIAADTLLDLADGMLAEVPA